MGRDHEAAKAHHGGDAVQRDAEHRAAGDERPAVGTALEVAQDHVEAELGGGADDEGQAPDIGQVELDAEDVHQADRPQDAQYHRHQAEHALA